MKFSLAFLCHLIFLVDANNGGLDVAHLYSQFTDKYMNDLI